MLINFKTAMLDLDGKPVREPRQKRDDEGLPVFEGTKPVVEHGPVLTLGRLCATVLGPVDNKDPIEQNLLRGDLMQSVYKEPDSMEISTQQAAMIQTRLAEHVSDANLLVQAYRAFEVSGAPKEKG